MCFIGGISLAKGSKVNARELAHNLLEAGEMRGTDASGFAFVTRDGRSGIYKNAVKGSQLKLKGLPRDANSVILHTRAATHGHQSDNRNNHPVESLGGRIRLAHNGVLYNHTEVRGQLKKGAELPEVDTSVLPQMIEEQGVDGTEAIAGDAAAAWFDTETSDTIHLARFSHSPVAVAQLVDGSFVFASTEAILGKALVASGLQWFGVYPGSFANLKESSYITLNDGDVTWQKNVSWNDNYRWGYGSTNWRATTDGGKSAVKSIAPKASQGTGAGIERKPNQIAWVAQMAITKTDEYEQMTSSTTPEYEAKKRVATLCQQAAARAGWLGSDMTDKAAWESFADQILTGEEVGKLVSARLKEIREAEDGHKGSEDKLGDRIDRAFDEAWGHGDSDEGDIDDSPSTYTDDFGVTRYAHTDIPVGSGELAEEDNFYAIDHDGDYVGLSTLASLMVMLQFANENSMEGAALTEDSNIAWINFYSDLGEIDEKGGLISWATDDSYIDDYDSYVKGGLAFVKQGISELRKVLV